MRKNAIFFIELPQGHDLRYSTYCYRSWEWWARKHGVHMLILKEPLIDPRIMPATWQRYWLFEILRKNNLDFDQIAMIDVDTMVRWDCPNFFDLTSNRFTSVLDHCGVGWTTQAIKGYQSLFPATHLDWWEFFFAGFVVVSATHQGFFRKINQFYLDNFLELNQRQISVRKGTDIAPINFLCKQENLQTTFLSPHFHLCSLGQKSILHDLTFIDHAFSWHFNGFVKTDRLAVMQATWERITKMYSGDTPGIDGKVTLLKGAEIFSSCEIDSWHKLYQTESLRLVYPPKKRSTRLKKLKNILSTLRSTR